MTLIATLARTAAICRFDLILDRFLLTNAANIFGNDRFDAIALLFGGNLGS